MKLENVRLSFEHVFEPVAFEKGGKEKFQATFLMDNEKHKSTIVAVKKAMKKCAEDKWGANKIPKSVKYCIHDGDEKEYDGYEGTQYINSSEQTRPHVVNRDMSPIVGADGLVYSGCYVNGNITFWAQDNQFGKRVNASLKGVQLVSAGEAFGAKRADVEDLFETIDEDDILS